MPTLDELLRADGHEWRAAADARRPDFSEFHAGPATRSRPGRRLLPALVAAALVLAVAAGVSLRWLADDNNTHPAGSTPTSQPSATSTAPISLASYCPHGVATGLAISIAAGVVGQPTPQLAIRAALRGTFGGYGAASNRWTPTGPRDDSDLIFRSGSALLWVGQLPDGSWIVDQGEICR
jgi:hypothetical protein